MALETVMWCNNNDGAPYLVFNTMELACEKYPEIAKDERAVKVAKSQIIMWLTNKILH